MGGAAAILSTGGAPPEQHHTVGGIRLPTHYCGIAGLKPTQGRVPRTGHIVSFDGPHQSLTHVGPMARYVEDLEYLFRILAGPDGIDPAIVAMLFNEPANVKIKELRTAFFTDNGSVPATEETKNTVIKAAKQMESLGSPVVEARPERVAEAYDFYVKILWADGGAWARRLLAKSGTTETLLEERLARFTAIPSAGTPALLENWDVTKPDVEVLAEP